MYKVVKLCLTFLKRQAIYMQVIYTLNELRNQEGFDYNNSTIGVILVVFHTLIKLSILCSCAMMFKLSILLFSLVNHMPKIFTGSLVHLYSFWVVNLKSTSLIEPNLKISVD